MPIVKDFEYDYNKELKLEEKVEAKYKAKSKNSEFDPIKYDKSGNTDSVVWTTKSLNVAIDAINKGIPLKANPFCGKNTQLLRPDLVYKRTKEELEDYIHCMQDPLYFATKCFLMTPTGLQPIILRDYQERYISHMAANRFTIYRACRQAGKCLTLNQLGDFIKGNTKQTLPFYLLFENYVTSEDWKTRINIYKQLDNGNICKEEAYSKLNELDNKYASYNKIVEEYDLYDIQIKTDTGYHNVSKLYLTKPFAIYKIKLKNGYELECADTHIVFTKYYKEIFVKNLTIGTEIITNNGVSKVISIEYNENKVCMVDITVDDDNHRFYSNGILSHNSTTTAIFALWKVLFNVDKQALIISKSGAAGRDLVDKIKQIYLNLPLYIKGGCMKYNQSEIAFDNNSSISTEAFSPTAGLGKTINFLILDEFAWLGGGANAGGSEAVETFYMNILPTITTISDSNICIMSTQNGFNLFYRLWKKAKEGTSMYAPFTTDWWEVPQWNPEKKIWEKRTEDWHKMMVGVLGSEEAFQYQYGTAFSSSDKCIISRETLKKLHSQEVKYEIKSDLPITVQYIDNLKWDPNFDLETLKTGFFIILVDLAEGGGNDYTVFNIIQVIEKDKFKQIGTWHANNVDIKNAALEFWLIWCQLFNNDRSLISIEWNTYGALFYQYLMNFNNNDYDMATSWRFNILNGKEELDSNLIIQYKKSSVEEEIADGIRHNSKTRPGIRWSGSSKKTACALLKFNLEKENIIPTDIITIGEIENFEDKNGNGSYEASEGHDDIIMTFCQIPMLMQTARYKGFIEDMESGIQLQSTETPEFYGNGWF